MIKIFYDTSVGIVCCSVVDKNQELQQKYFPCMYGQYGVLPNKMVRDGVLSIYKRLYHD